MEYKFGGRMGRTVLSVCKCLWCHRRFFREYDIDTETYDNVELLCDNCLRGFMLLNKKQIFVVKDLKEFEPKILGEENENKVN